MIDPRRVFVVHLLIIGLLGLAAVPIVIMDGMGHRVLFGYARLMRLEQEANVPSIFSALALAACAVVASAVHAGLANGDRDRPAWRLLALFFAFLAFDEAAMIHELANLPGNRFQLGGLLTNIGVLLYLPVIVWLGFRLFPFWLRQEPKLRFVLFAAGAIYVVGAIGFELVENDLRGRGLTNGDVPIQIGFIFEECSEMLGVALFLRAFLERFSQIGGGPLVRLAVRGVDEPAGLQNTSVSSIP